MAFQEERQEIPPASSTPAAPKTMTPEPNNLDAILPTSLAAIANTCTVASSGQASEVMATLSKAEEVQHRWEVEAALKSPVLTTDQRTSLHTVRNKFKFLNDGVLDMLLGFARGMEV